MCSSHVFWTAEEGLPRDIPPHNASLTHTHTHTHTHNSEGDSLLHNTWRDFPASHQPPPRWPPVTPTSVIKGPWGRKRERNEITSCDASRATSQHCLFLETDFSISISQLFMSSLYTFFFYLFLPLFYLHLSQLLLLSIALYLVHPVPRHSPHRISTESSADFHRIGTTVIHRVLHIFPPLTTSSVFVY